MNEKLIFEVGDIMHIRFRGFFKKRPLTPKEILESIEVKNFLENYPELKRLCYEGGENGKS